MHAFAGTVGFIQAEVMPELHLFFYAACMRSAGAALYLQDVALLDGGVLQLAGLLLQSLSRAANWQAGQYLLWQPEGALTLLHGHHLLLEALHFHQETLG